MSSLILRLRWKLLSGLLSFYLAPSSISSGMVPSSLAINVKALWPCYRVSATPIGSVTRGSRLWCNALSSGLSNWRSGGDLSPGLGAGRSSRLRVTNWFSKISALLLVDGDGRLQTEASLDDLDVVRRHDGVVAAATVALARGTVLAIANQIQTPDEAAADAGLFPESREQLLHRL